MKTPNKVASLELETTCVGTTKSEWDNFMTGATIANKRIINSLIKQHIPELYTELSLNLNTYYKYYKTDTHLILVHSAIEYFLRYKLWQRKK